MLERLQVWNYRSLRDTAIDLGRLTVVTGPNGSGKSNLYSALRLVQAAASGNFATALLHEGGMPSALWAGRRRKGPVRMGFRAQWHDLTHELIAGLPQEPPRTPFVLDPEIKQEHVHFGPSRTPATTLADRSRVHAELTTVDGDHRRLMSLLVSESLLDQVGEPALYPELDELRRRIRGWRFYHQFDTGRASPIRRPRPGVRTGALAADGHDLGAAIATLTERGDKRALDDAVSAAFPGYRVEVTGDPGTNRGGILSRVVVAVRQQLASRNRQMRPSSATVSRSDTSSAAVASMRLRLKSSMSRP